MIYGNTNGIKKTLLDSLEELSSGEIEKRLAIDEALISRISEISKRINREICVYISRGGKILSIGIGDSGTVSALETNLRRSKEKLSGVRCFHTHLNGSSELSKQDLVTLNNHRMDMIAAVDASEGIPGSFTMAFIRAGGEFETVRAESFSSIDHDAVFAKIAEAEKLFSAAPVPGVQAAGEGAILVAVSDGDAGIYIEELEGLAETAGLRVLGYVTQKKAAPDKYTCIGSGKLDEAAFAVREKKADIVVFDNELTGVQLKKLEEALSVKVIDRAMLILEIFARHAVTNEGKLQVELAKLKYTLPKLLGQGKALSRIGGGAGTATKGAGETKLETDRRHIKRSIFELTERIEKLKRERGLRRENRLNSRVKTVAIVGYTNSGKSTLMNALSKSSVRAEDKLFATLDPVTRKVWNDGREYLLTDTVGFIDRLPHELIEAFRSTLEESKYADLLLHVADASSASVLRQYDVVLKVLESLGISGKPIITVYNKCDLPQSNEIKPTLTDSVVISAKTGQGIAELKELINLKLYENQGGI